MLMYPSFLLGAILSKISGGEKCPQSDVLVGEKKLVGRCHDRLLLAALLLYLFGIKEGARRQFLSDAPSNPFLLPRPQGTSIRYGAALAMHLLVGFPINFRVVKNVPRATFW